MSRALALVLFLLASAALACPVCGAEKDEGVFLSMTIFMSLTPLIAMGSVGWVVWSRAKAQDRDPPPPPQ